MGERLIPIRVVSKGMAVKVKETKAEAPRGNNDERKKNKERIRCHEENQRGKKRRGKLKELVIRMFFYIVFTLPPDF